jgi:hypothetical protein
MTGSPTPRWRVFTDEAVRPKPVREAAGPTPWSTRLSLVEKAHCEVWSFSPEVDLAAARAAREAASRA